MSPRGEEETIDATSDRAWHNSARKILKKERGESSMEKKDRNEI